MLVESFGPLHPDDLTQMFSVGHIELVQLFLGSCSAVAVVEHHRGDLCLVYLQLCPEVDLGALHPDFLVVLECKVSKVTTVQDVCFTAAFRS